MKRVHKPTYVPFTGRFSIKGSLDEKQLAGIGAVALAYNYAENSINKLFVEIAGVRKDVSRDVVTRINGIDGKTAIIKKGFRTVTEDENILRMINALFGEKGPFTQCKRYRDALIHSRVLDSEAGTGIYDIHRDKIWDVMHSVDALDVLFDTLDLLRSEIAKLSVVYRILNRIRSTRGDLLAKERYEQHLQVCLAQVLEIQRMRSSLPKFPEFPEPRPFPAASEFDPVDLSERLFAVAGFHRNFIAFHNALLSLVGAHLST